MLNPTQIMSNTSWWSSRLNVAKMVMMLACRVSHLICIGFTWPWVIFILISYHLISEGQKVDLLILPHTFLDFFTHSSETFWDWFCSTMSVGLNLNLVEHVCSMRPALCLELSLLPLKQRRKQEQSAIQGANRVPCIFIPDENRFILNAHSKQNQKTLLAGAEPNTGQIKNPAISRNHNITSTVARCGQQPWYIQRSFAYIMFQVSTCIYGNRTLPSGMSFHKTSGPKPRKHVPSSTMGNNKTTKSGHHQKKHH